MNTLLGSRRGFLASLSNGLLRCETYLARALVVCFVLLITVNVAMRYIGGRPLIFAEEIAAVMLVWLAFISVSISIHGKRQIGISILVDILSPQSQRIIQKLVSLLLIAILVVLLWKSCAWVFSLNSSFERVITINMPKWPLFIVLPIFCLTSLIHIIAQLFEG